MTSSRKQKLITGKQESRQVLYSKNTVSCASGNNYFCAWKKANHSSLDAQNIRPIETPRDNLFDAPLAAFPTNTPSPSDGSQRVKAEERQRLFTFDICAPTLCLATRSGRGCYYTLEFTAKQQQKPERLPQDHAPLLLHRSILSSPRVEFYPLHLENSRDWHASNWKLLVQMASAYAAQ